MNQIVFEILQVPVAILIYGSGLLLWPIRRWLHRKQAVRGRFMLFVFVAQLAAYAAAACCSIFIRLDHFYYSFIFLIELNIAFTVAGVIAWIRDARYERTAKVSHAI